MYYKKTTYSIYMDGGVQKVKFTLPNGKEILAPHSYHKYNSMPATIAEICDQVLTMEVEDRDNLFILLLEMILYADQQTKKCF